MSLNFGPQSHLHLPHNGLRLEIRGEIRGGEIVGLQGASGCGKSTFLRHVAQVGENPLELLLGNKPVSTYSDSDRRIALVFQRALLFPHLSVAENLRFPLEHQAPFLSWSRDLQAQRAHEFLRQFGMETLAERAPASLSGGESIRVAILRAMVSTPRCLLLDEAFTALDKETKARVKIWLKNIIRENNLPTLIVAHVEEDLVDFADRVVQWPEPGAAQVLQF